MEERGKLTVFGVTVLELMSRRGLRTWTALSERLEDHGYDFKPSRMSNWAFGRHAVDRHFGHALADALGLTAEERQRLADAFLYGQDTVIDGSGVMPLGFPAALDDLPIPETDRR